MHIIYVYTTLYKVLNNGAYSQQKVNYNALITVYVPELVTLAVILHCYEASTLIFTQAEVVQLN